MPPAARVVHAAAELRSLAESWARADHQPHPRLLETYPGHAPNPPRPRKTDAPSPDATCLSSLGSAGTGDHARGSPCSSVPSSHRSPRLRHLGCAPASRLSSSISPRGPRPGIGASIPSPSPVTRHGEAPRDARRRRRARHLVFRCGRERVTVRRRSFTQRRFNPHLLCHSASATSSRPPPERPRVSQGAMAQRP